MKIMALYIISDDKERRMEHALQLRATRPFPYERAVIILNKSIEADIHQPFIMNRFAKYVKSVRPAIPPMPEAVFYYSLISDPGRTTSDDRRADSNSDGSTDINCAKFCSLSGASGSLSRRFSRWHEDMPRTGQLTYVPTQ